MKKLSRSKIIAVFALVGLVFATANCGTILYPERKGQESGNIDVEVLVMDCLWLLVGVVPGVVALVVDFTTGAIYEPAMTVQANKDTRLSFRIRDAAPVDAAVEVVLEDALGDSRVLMQREVEKGESINEVMIDLPEDTTPGEYTLAVNVDGNQSAVWNLSVN